MNNIGQKNIDLPLSSLANGEIQEKLDRELQKIFDNIHDPNTKAKDKRTVTLKLEFTPDEKRQAIEVSSNISVKLANLKDVTMTVLTDRDLTTGAVVAKELKSNMPGQSYLDDDGSHRTDVGEPVDVIEKEEERRKIINLQTGRG